MGYLWIVKSINHVTLIAMFSGQTSVVSVPRSKECCLKFTPSQHYVQVNCQLQPLAWEQGLQYMDTNESRVHMNTMAKREVSALIENRTWSLSS